VWARRWRAAIVATVALLAGAVAVPRVVHAMSSGVAGLADGEALLVVADDSQPPGDPYAWVRSEERRADTVLVVRWLRSCDRLEITSLPRDAILEGSDEPAAVVFGVGGIDALVTAVERTFGIEVFAAVTLGFDEVSELAEAVGPVDVEVAAPSRDRRTGFMGGPGRVSLDAPAAIAFLRSRHWEELRGGQWMLATDDDRSRIERQHTYFAAAISAARRLSLADQVRVGIAMTQGGDVTVYRPQAVPGFLAGATHAGEVALATIPVQPELTIDERRSPFSPARLGAAQRYVLAPGAQSTFIEPGCVTTAGP
jgi:LCP family protein required for cell wall assembly